MDSSMAAICMWKKGPRPFFQGEQPPVPRICPPRADKSHTCRLRRDFPDAHVAGENGFSLHARLRARALRGSFDGFIAVMDSPMTALCYCRRSFRDEAAAAQVFCTGCRIPADSFISKIRKTDWSTCSREMVPCRTASSTAGI